MDVSPLRKGKVELRVNLLRIPEKEFTASVIISRRCADRVFLVNKEPSRSLLTKGKNHTTEDQEVKLIANAPVIGRRTDPPSHMLIL